jgi:hypothetical protein
MLNKDEKLAFCNRCIHKKHSDRYGILCSLTDNYPHFSFKCENFVKSNDSQASFNSPKEALKEVTQKTKSNSRLKKGGWLGKGIVIYIIFRIVLKLIKQYL